jgi:ADP-ribose pyrophosphatase
LAKSAPQDEPSVDSRVAYQGKIVNLRVDTVKLPGGKLGNREIVEHVQCVCVVPLDEGGNVVMVRQYRKPVEEFLLEIPAGGMDPGESPEGAAQRELQEETGYVAEELVHLSSFWTTPGFCTELMHAYVARGLRPGALTPDEDENIEVVRVPLSGAADLIRRGEIKDAKSIVSLLLVLDRP